MKRQFRIYVNGKFQFSLTSTDSCDTVAANVSEAMKLGNLRASFAPGMINFVPLT